MWLAIYVPNLPLQAFSPALSASTPVVVFERDSRRDVIIACNREAISLGIKVSCTLAEANALSNRLTSLQRDYQRETGCLQQLAHATSHLTPNIHISKDFGLLLEITGSLALFGGEQALLDQAIAAIEQQRMRAHVVLAPTARGARWLSRAHRQLIVTHRLEEWLDDLPLNCMDISSKLIQELRELNLHHLAAVRQLPNKELNQRFGCELTNALAQAYGQTAQSLPLWRPDTHFQQYVEFLDLARELDHWMPGVIVLLQQLQGFLRLHAATTTVVKFCFSHGHQQRTTIEVHASHGLRHTDQWMRLFAARIERQPVVHEVSRIDLFCDQLHEADLHELDFFDQSSAHQQEWQSLLNLISTRLGNQAIVKSPRNPHNALPESISTAQQKAPAALSIRPAWLIDPPRLLCGELLRNLRTTLNLRQPERVESNWSSATGTDAPCRDYYIAKTINHSIWWIFRDRISEQWFLHGIFA